MLSGYFRNSACRITDDIRIKGYKSLIIENNLLQVVILLDKGTDIFKIIYKPLGIDILGKAPVGLRPRDFAIQTSVMARGNYLDFYEGGWQEVFPSGGGPRDDVIANQGLHGEVWGLCWDWDVLSDTADLISVKLSTRTYRTPFYIEKIISLKKNNPVIYLDEKIKNIGQAPHKYMWGHHPAFGAPLLSENAYLELSDGTIKTMQFAGPNSRFENDVEFDWPKGKSKNGDSVDVSRFLAQGSMVEDMLFLTDFSKPYYSIINEKLNCKVTLQWQREMFPYLWLWLQYNGGVNFPFFGNTYLVALEPFSFLPGDTNLPVLLPGAEKETHLLLKTERKL